MVTFRDFIQNEPLVEGAGSLSGLPKSFIKAIVTSYEGNYGGENSKFELFKKDAKQKDVTAAAKMTGGYVAPDKKSSSYSRHSSSAEKEAEKNKKLYAGVIIKMDDEYSFMVSYQDYTEAGGNFKLTAADGSAATKKRSEKKNYGSRNYYEFDSKYLKATEISDFIDFDNSTVDVYLVTADQERLAKRDERSSVKKDTADSIKNSPEKKAALIKFLDKKAGGMLSDYEEAMNTKVKELADNVSNIFKEAAKGEYTSTDVSKLMEPLIAQLKHASSLAYSINSVVKDGTIQDRWDKDKKTWAYDSFMKLVKDIPTA